MAQQHKYRCPVCNKSLTKTQYERALHIHEARQEHVEQQKRQLAQERRDFESRRKQVQQQVRAAERARTLRIVGNKDRKIGELMDRIKLLKRGKTPQEYGPEFEAQLVRRLRVEFDGDEIRPTPGSRGGDVLHIVKEGGKVAGTIIYECKWTPRISGSHVRQAAQAKMMRRAEFAVLVTSGTRNGFGGMAEMAGILIVAPPCVLSIVGLLRLHLVEMLRAGIEKRRRAKIADQLLKFIKSAEFKNPMEEVVRTAESLKEGVEEEYRWHVADWKKRLSAYERIRWDGAGVQENLRRVFHGETPKQMIQPKVIPALPVATA
jgi:hypothetical protein